MLPRFFIPSAVLSQAKEVALSGEDLRHFKALRLKRGDCLLLCDGEEREYPGEILSFSSREVKVKVGAPVLSRQEPLVKTILVQALPKGDRFGEIVRRGTEIGVKKITPLLSRRVVARLSPAQGEARRERWQKIAREAAQQSQRGVVPVVSSPVSLEDCLSNLSPQALLLVLWEGEKKKGLKEFLAEFPGEAGFPPVAVFVGPEGGWAPEEVVQLTAAGAHPVSLGPRILRTETAGLVALAAILFAWGDLGGNKCGK